MKLLHILACSLVAYAAAASPLHEAIENLKAELHTLSKEETTSRFSELDKLRGPPPPHQDKIDHMVVLLMENHAADQMLGCMDLPGFDGIPKAGRQIKKLPETGTVNVTCGKVPYVCSHGPGYDLFSSKFKKGSNSHTYPYDEQSDDYSYQNGAQDVAIQMMSPEEIPVKSTLAHEYGVFNRLYSAVPSASTPNHLFIQSGTSCGIVDNIMYSQCGGPTATFPQFTIYDSLWANNVSFGFYMNSTCGMHGHKPCAGIDPNTPAAGSPIYTPDVALSGVGRYKNHFRSQELFYDQAANGSLPALSWLLPPTEACDHPCYDIAKGERLLKDVYEALRAGPNWGKTMLFVVYDDAGQYYDHVTPPHEGVPTDDAPCHLLDQCPGRQKFDFRRLGIRNTGFLMSPWIKKGSVFQTPKGPTNTSQFELTSVPATLKNLFNLSGFLTKRDMWAGSFHELLTDTPRSDADMPLHLPAAPKPAKPWSPPPNMTHGGKSAGAGSWTLNGTDMGIDVGGPVPQHCGMKEQVCRGPEKINTKQRRKIRELSSAIQAGSTGEGKAEYAVPENLEEMSHGQADVWLSKAWDRWMEL